MRRIIPVVIMAVLFIVLFGVKRCLYRDIAAKRNAERGIVRGGEQTKPLSKEMVPVLP